MVRKLGERKQDLISLACKECGHVMDGLAVESKPDASEFYCSKCRRSVLFTAITKEDKAKGMV